ncbi:hypothetical protein [Haliovirga abyssi]|uniref:DZANK-type domain-containing protein n=1 Tax=Haliovirga abyssi TaxID=2996794 RepID=A0AAU9D8A7_9FUSO|nr:hypothetical protein [Haliovirga abyssi]BDU49480.1 hypothetical protein HLVA_00490 [Haliovirga abyssi]
MNILVFVKEILPYGVFVFLAIWFGDQIKILIPKISKLIFKDNQVVFDQAKKSEQDVINRYICKKCSNLVKMGSLCAKCGEKIGEENTIDLLVYTKAIHAIEKCVCPVCGNGILGKTTYVCPNCGFGFEAKGKKSSTFQVLKREIGVLATIYLLLGAFIFPAIIYILVEKYLYIDLTKNTFGVIIYFVGAIIPVLLIAINLNKDERRERGLYRIVKKYKKIESDAN